jgi:hypothetical protein
MNIPSIGNSEEKTQKQPRLAILAAAAAAVVLLSAISFIGVGGAIPQSQHAFAQLEDGEEVDEDEECPPGTRPDVDEGTCVPIPDGEGEDEEESMNNNGDEQQQQ